MRRLQTSFDGFTAINAALPTLLLFEFCALIARNFGLLTLRNHGVEDLLARNASALITPVVLGILMIPLLRDNWSALREQLSFHALSWHTVLLSAGLGLALRAAWWLTTVIRISPGSPVSPAFHFQCPQPVLLAFTIFVLAVSTPVVEEVFNRGFLLRVLLPRGNIVAVIVSSLLFGLIHRPDFIVFASIAGGFFALLYLRMRNLWAPILAHATFNILSIFDQVCLGISWTAR